MGQQHRAFLIARISNGGDQARYRCLAAFDLACWGLHPVRATRRFLILAKQPCNAAIIREELNRIEKNGIDDPMYPSHYLSSLLGCAFNIGLEEKNSHDSSFVRVSGQETLEAGFLPVTRCWDKVILDITNCVIDITDPEHGAYCFLEYPDGPYTADSFMETDSMEREDLEKDLVDLIDFWAEVPLIKSEAIAETWPRPFRKARMRATQGPLEAGAVPAKDSVSRFVPSLADLALLPSIKYALAKNDIEPIMDILWMPGKANAILEILKSPDFDPIPESALPLVVRALNQSPNEHELDISRFPLTDDQILSVIRERQGLRTLNISYNPNVTIATVRMVLSTVSSVKRLVLFGTDIVEEDWGDLLTDYPKLFYHLESLIHPCFYQAKEAFYPCTFTFVWQSDSNHTGPSTATLPFFTPTLIVEALAQIFSSRAFLKNINCLQTRILRSAAGAVVLSHEVLGASQPWGERAIPFFAPPSPIGESSDGGWTFFMVERASRSSEQVEIGFVKCDMKKSDIVIKMFDFMGFISELEKEGRPAPPKNTVKTLTEAFVKLTNPSETWNSGWKPAEWCPYRWLTQTTAEKLIYRLQQDISLRDADIDHF